MLRPSTCACDRSPLSRVMVRRRKPDSLCFRRMRSLWSRPSIESERTTRVVTLTDAGLDFLARIEIVLAELDEAEHAAGATGELRGILRIGLATNFAVREVIPRLSDFMNRH